MPSASRSSLLYLDSSALVKLVVAEPETPALIEFLAGWPHRVSSVLARVEVLRAVKRATAGPAVSHVQLTTGDVDAFRAVARRLFGDTFVDVEAVELAAVAS